MSGDHTPASPDRRFRFVILVWGVVPGGTLSVLRDWVPRLAGRGDVTVVSLGPDRDSLGVPTVTIGTRWAHPFRFPQVIGYVARMAGAAARRARGDRTVLVPQDALATGAAAVIAGALTGAPVVVMEHGSAEAVATDRFWAERSSAGAGATLRRWLLRRTLIAMHHLVLRRIELALVAGDEAAATYRSRGVAADRLVRYRFGIDLDLFHPPTDAERAEARRRWGLTDGGPVILSVGRLAPEKGLDDLIAAVAALPADLASQLVLAGEGPARSRLKRAASEAGITVTFVGGLEPTGVASIMRAADCFVYAATRGANTPVAVLEAMASGLPVVATAAPAVHRAMLAGGRGAAIEPGDRQALGAALERYVREPSAAAETGLAARRYVEEHHAPGQVDRAVEVLVDRLGAGTSVSRRWLGGGRRPSGHA